MKPTHHQPATGAGSDGHGNTGPAPARPVYVLRVWHCTGCGYTVQGRLPVTVNAAHYVPTQCGACGLRKRFAMEAA